MANKVYQLANVTIGATINVYLFLTRDAVHQIQRSYYALGRIFLTLVLTLIFS